MSTPKFTEAKFFGAVAPGACGIMEGMGKGQKIYTAIVHEEDGGYWAEVAGLPGCFTEADTLDELKANLREAISLYLEDEETVADRAMLMQVAV